MSYVELDEWIPNYEWLEDLSIEQFNQIDERYRKLYQEFCKEKSTKDKTNTTSKVLSQIRQVVKIHPVLNIYVINDNNCILFYECLLEKRRHMFTVEELNDLNKDYKKYLKLIKSDEECVTAIKNDYFVVAVKEF